MSNSTSGRLKRNLTLAAVVSLGINGVIGQGIFLTPGKAALRMGPSAMTALLLAGLLCFLIALCFAEVGSRFRETGGAYLYARKAFGSFVGFEVGWMTCCVAILSWATLANGFTHVLAKFIPEIASGIPQKVVAVSVVSGLTLVNLFGVKSGAWVVKFFTVAKLIPICAFIAVGAFFIEGRLFTPFSPHGYGPLPETTIILLYAYAGFETMVVPAGEMDNPKRAVPMALFIVLGVCTVVYVAVFGVATGTFSGLAGHMNPVAEAATQFMGTTGGMLIAIGICLSVFGTNSGSALVNPRRFFALAERGDLPRFLCWVHPKTGAPVPAILLTWFATVALTIIGSFEQLLVIGVLARFAQYIPTCLAVLVLRRRADYDPDAGYTLPFGPLIPILALGLCGWLLVHQDPQKLKMGGYALLAGVPVYLLTRLTSKAGSTSPTA
ncbi:MAG: APC family permease [Myxococcota bacterium]|nr:APC family permease [Myxococcota bacterium]